MKMKKCSNTNLRTKRICQEYVGHSGFHRNKEGYSTIVWTDEAGTFKTPNESSINVIIPDSFRAIPRER